MIGHYSIAETRNRFAEIVHNLERVPHVEVTRRGRPVAILFSVQEFERLRTGGARFGDAYQAFREAFHVSELGIAPDIFDGLRDRTPGREMSL